jgi:hypothetical protein
VSIKDLIADEHQATSELLDVARQLDDVLLSAYPADAESVPGLKSALVAACRKLLACQDRIDVAKNTFAPRETVQ